MGFFPRSRIVTVLAMVLLLRPLHCGAALLQRAALPCRLPPHAAALTHHTAPHDYLGPHTSAGCAPPIRTSLANRLRTEGAGLTATPAAHLFFRHHCLGGCAL